MRLRNQVSKLTKERDDLRSDLEKQTEIVNDSDSDDEFLTYDLRKVNFAAHQPQ